MGSGADERLGERERIAEAREKGYEEVACTECGNFTLVRNGGGYKYKCDTCGNEYDGHLKKLPHKDVPETELARRQPDESIFPTRHR
jgi:ribosomal protein L37AE/L43A